MITVGKLLEKKGHQVWSVHPDDSVYHGLEMMSEKQVGALAVVKDNQLIGVISERDYARKIILHDRTSKDTRVREIMTNDVHFAGPEQTVDQCLAIMNKRQVRHLPVMLHGQLYGFISISDVVAEILIEQAYTIQQLENNISWAEAY